MNQCPSLPAGVDFFGLPHLLLPASAGRLIHQAAGFLNNHFIAHH
jgi:hypothetical protein